MISVHSLHYYPVKSFRGLSEPSLTIDEFGPKMDRRFMLVDDAGKFVTQRSDPLLSQADAKLSDSALVINLPGDIELSYSLSSFVQEIATQVWGDEVLLHGQSLTGNDEALSRWLGRDVRLAFMTDACFRQVDRDFFDQDQRVSLADGFPLLLTNLASLHDLNARLSEPVTMKRFRPNIVIQGYGAFEEDEWSEIRVGEVTFAVVKPCSRCIMTTIDDQGNKGREPLKTLSTYRRNEFGVCFGQNLVPLNVGTIKEGDSLEVLR